MHADTTMLSFDAEKQKKTQGWLVVHFTILVKLVAHLRFDADCNYVGAALSRGQRSKVSDSSQMLAQVISHSSARTRP